MSFFSDKVVRALGLWNNRVNPISNNSMNDFIDADGFRANVGIVLMREDRQVFLGGRTGGRGWQFPQGGVQQRETPEEALYRELKEEVGLEPKDVKLVAGTRNWLRYRLPKQYVRKNSNPPCIGQKQRWFLLKFTGSEDRCHAGFFEHLQFFAQRCQPRRGGFRRKELARVRFEGHHARLKPTLCCVLAQCLQNCAMAAMHAIEIADGKGTRR